VIPFGRKGSERKAEAILPRKLAVTAAGIASGFGEYWQNVLLKGGRHR
jgi:hypothetical protein